MRIGATEDTSSEALETNSKLEAFLQFPSKGRDRVLKTIQLKPDAEGHWGGEYDLRDVPLTTASLSFRGADSKGQFVASSATVVTLTYGLCPSCGSTGKISWEPCGSCGQA